MTNPFEGCEQDIRLLNMVSNGNRTILFDAAIDVERFIAMVKAFGQMKEALERMIEAIETSNIDSPEIEGDMDAGIPPHRWHDEWLYRAKRSIASAEEVEKMK